MKDNKFTTSCRKWSNRGYRQIFLLGGIIFMASTMCVPAYAAEQQNQWTETISEVGDEISLASTMMLVEVAQDGSKDCATIAEALYLVQNGGTIIIYPGTYRESVKIRDKKVTIQGTNKDSCIIESEEGLYQKAPIDMGCGTLLNLTIYCKAPTDRDISGDIQAYTIHCDDAGAVDHNFTVSHCTLISDLNYVIGIGGRENLSLSLFDCELISNNAGSIFYHDAPVSTIAGDIFFSMQQCKLYNHSMQPTFVALSLCENNKTYFCLQNNYVEETKKIDRSILTKDWQSGSEWFGEYGGDAQEYGPEVRAFLDIVDLYYNPPVEEDGEENESTEQEVVTESEQDVEEPALNKWYGISTFYLDETSGGNTLSAMNYETAYVTY